MTEMLKLLKMQKELERRLNGELTLEERYDNQIEALLEEKPPDKVVGKSGWTYHERAFFCLRPSDQPRRTAIFFVEWRWFDPIILVTIIANCSSMAWESPLDPCCTWKADFIDILEMVYLYIFTVELLSKVLAYGLVGHEHSYLRDAWCQLDATVVTLAWLPILIPSFPNYSVIRSVRALRPLRALKRVPGMPAMISSIMAAMPKLGNVVALCGFIFLVFGIVGMELFKGTLHYRCATPGLVETPGHPRRLQAVLGGDLSGTNASMVGAVEGDSWSDGSLALLRTVAAAASPWQHLSGRSLKAGAGGGGLGTDDEHAQAGFDTGIPCNPADPSNTCRLVTGGPSRCAYFDQNPSFDLMSFDNVAVAQITLMQALTMDTWTDCMYALDVAFGSAANVYFILIVVLGGFFIVNLFLAVIFEEFLAAQQLEAAKDDMAERAESAAAASARSDVEQGGGKAAADNGKDTTALLADGDSAGDSRGCCDCGPPPGSWRRVVGDVMTSEALGNASTALVVFNIGLMCMPYYGMSEEYEGKLEDAASVVTWIFIGEMFFKLIGLGCANYWADGWNQLDGVIVSLSIIEMLVTVLLADSGLNISFLRMLRLLRLLRLLKAWPALYKIVMTTAAAVPQLGNIFVLMFLITVIFSLLGMQLFGGMFDEKAGFSPLPCDGGVCADGLEELPRYHFDYFAPAMITCFVLMTGAWVDPLGPAVEAAGPYVSIFYLTVVIVGCYIIMNLFIAILLNAFADSEDVEEEGGEEGDEQDENNAKEEEAAPPLPAPESDGQDPPWPVDHSLCCFGPRSGVRQACLAIVADTRFDQFIITAIIVSSICLALDVPRLDPDGALAHTLNALNLVWTWLFFGELMLKVIAFGFIFGENAYVKSPWNLLDLTIVTVSFLVLASEVFPALRPLKTLRILRVLRPLRLLSRNPGMKMVITSLFKTMPAVGNVFGVVLTLQLVFAILGMQMFAGALGSCSDPTISLVAACHAAPSAPPASPGFETPLPDTYSYQYEFPEPLPPQLPYPPSPPLPPGLLAIVNEAVGAAGNAITGGDASGRRLALDADGVWSSTGSGAMSGVASGVADGLAASVIGAALGTLNAPSQPRWQGPVLQQQGGPEAASVQRPHAPSTWRSRRRLREGRSGRQLKSGGGGGAGGAIVWANPATGSFDDFGSAMLLLYIMSTADGWDALMFATMDAQGPGLGPKRNDFSAAALFSIAWMFIGCFFSLNLFVGAIVDEFSKIKSENDGVSATMTPEQQQWVETMKTKANAKPVKALRPPTDPLRRFFCQIVTSAAFDSFIMLVIVSNVAVMACDYWGIEQDAANFAAYTQALFVFGNIYYCEATLKIIGLGPGNYFADGWCRFDFFLVSTSLLDQFAAELLASVLPIPPMVLRVLRVLRILRILRLLKGPGAKNIKDLIVTMVLSFPALINVGSVLLLIVFMFAVLGVNVFTYVVQQENITTQRNFETLGNAMLLLFQCLTGDNWSGLMSDALVEEASGLCTTAAGNCGSKGSIAYFIAFQLLGSFVFLNLVVAVILENFSSLGNLNPELVSAADLENFKEAWSVFDPDGDSKIPMTSLPDVIMSIPPPMGLQGVARSRRDAIKLCMRLKMRNIKSQKLEPVRQEKGEVYFADVVDALVQLSYDSKKVSVDDAVAEIEDVSTIVEGVPSAAGLPVPELAKAENTYELGEDFAYGMQHDIDKIFALEIIGNHLDKLRRWAARATARVTARHAERRRKAYAGVSANSPATNTFRALRLEEARQLAATANASSAFHAQSMPTGAPTPQSARVPSTPCAAVPRRPPAPASARGSIGSAKSSSKPAGVAAAGAATGKALTVRAPSFGTGGSRPPSKPLTSSRAQIAPAPLPPPSATVAAGQPRAPLVPGGFGPNAVACSERRRGGGATPPPPLSVPSTLRGNRNGDASRPSPGTSSARGALQRPAGGRDVSCNSPEAAAAAAELRAEFRSMRQQARPGRASATGSTPGTPACDRSPLTNGDDLSSRTTQGGLSTPGNSARPGGALRVPPSIVPPISPAPPGAANGALEEFRALRSARASTQPRAGGSARAGSPSPSA